MGSPIRPDAPVGIPLPVRPPAATVDPEAPSFAELLKGAINDVTGLQQERDDLIAAFLRGEPVELHQVMAAAEEASISLELLVEIRNKLVEAYRTVMNIQA
jgi:flagellar hook-basal body complex protein FliE